MTRIMALLKPEPKHPNGTYKLSLIEGWIWSHQCLMAHWSSLILSWCQLIVFFLEQRRKRTELFAAAIRSTWCHFRCAQVLHSSPWNITFLSRAVPQMSYFWQYNECVHLRLAAAIPLLVITKRLNKAWLSFTLSTRDLETSKSRPFNLFSLAVYQST